MTVHPVSRTLQGVMETLGFTVLHVARRERGDLLHWRIVVERQGEDEGAR